MTAKQLIMPANRAFDSNGFPEIGATVSLYLSGTSTPATFYADSGLTQSLGSVITSNSAGRFYPMPYQDSTVAFRLVTKDIQGNPLDDIDPYYFGTLNGAIGPQGPAGDVAKSATRTALSGITGLLGSEVRFLTEPGREGMFVFSTANLSTQVSADPSQGIYIAPAFDATGASGAWVRKIDSFANVMWWGAVGDGVTDDTAAFNSAKTYAAANNKWLHGFGKTYAVTGKISAVSNLWLRDITFKQLAPGASASVITFEASGCGNLRLVGLKVNRNGDGTNGGFAQSTGVNGCMGSAYGIHIVSCTNSIFEDLEVYGNDTGTGIWFSLLNGDCRIIRPIARDMTGTNPIATDQNIQGLRFDQCVGLTVVYPIVRNFTLTYNSGANTDNQWTRGIGISGSSNLTFIGAEGLNINEGFDISSSADNVDIVVLGGSMSGSYSWGYKLANLARRCQIIGARAISCGKVGFVDNAAYDTIPMPCDANLFDSCTAINCGDPTLFSGASGFGSLNSPHTYQHSATFRNCIAVDERVTPLMVYGFYNEKAAANNCLINFEHSRSFGHTTAPFYGEMEDRCHVSISADISIANNTNTEVAWDTDIDNTSAMHSTSLNPGRITIKKDGHYLIMVRTLWTGNATGIRRISVQKGGTTITGAISDTSGQTNNHTHSFTWQTVRLKVGDTIGISVLQNSGGGLALKGTGANNETGLIIQRLAS